MLLKYSWVYIQEYFIFVISWMKFGKWDDNINKILNLKQDYNIINNLFPLSTM